VLTHNEREWDVCSIDQIKCDGRTNTRRINDQRLPYHLHINDIE
jgi:hypothetical protein